MGLTLGLLTAVAWGASDFLARFVARRIGSFRTTLYMQFIGLVLLTIFLPRVGGFGHLFRRLRVAAMGVGRSRGYVQRRGFVGSLPLLRIRQNVHRRSDLGQLPGPNHHSFFFLGRASDSARFAGVALIVIGVVLVARGEASGITAEAASHGDAGNPTVRAVRKTTESAGLLHPPSDSAFCSGCWVHA